MTADGRARSKQLWDMQRIAATGGVVDVEYDFQVLDAADPQEVGPTLSAFAAAGWRVDQFQYVRKSAFVAVLLVRTVPAEVVR